MRLVELEIGRHDWAGMPCGCQRSAEHVGSALLKLAHADSVNKIQLGYIDNHVDVQGVLYEPAVPAVSVALAALADDVAPPARRVFCDLLLNLIAGDGQSQTSRAAGRDLVAECVAAARLGIWTLYSEIFHGESIDARSYCYEILAQIEVDHGRIESVQNVVAEGLAPDLQP